MKNRIDQYGFVENQDYQILAPQNYGASWEQVNGRKFALVDYIDPIPEFIVKNALRNLGMTKKDFFEIHFDCR